MSRALFTHDRQHSLAHSNGAEEIRFKLHPKLVERDVFNESGHREAGIIHQHIDPAVVAHNSIDTFRDPFKLCHIQRSHINVSCDARRGRCGCQLLAPSQIPHRRHYTESGPRQFDCRQKSKSARRSRNHCDLVRHANGVPQRNGNWNCLFESATICVKKPSVAAERMLEGGSHAGSQAPSPSHSVFSVSPAAHSVLAAKCADSVWTPDLVSGHSGKIASHQGQSKSFVHLSVLGGSTKRSPVILCVPCGDSSINRENVEFLSSATRDAPSCLPDVNLS